MSRVHTEPVSGGYRPVRPPTSLPLPVMVFKTVLMITVVLLLLGSSALVGARLLGMGDDLEDARSVRR